MELAPDLPEQDWSRGENGSYSLRHPPRVLLKVYYLKQIFASKKALHREIPTHDKI